MTESVKLHVVNRVSGEGFVFRGFRGSAVVLERNGDQEIEIVARWCFQRDYQATCSHFYGQHDSCPMCDAAAPKVGEMWTTIPQTMKVISVTDTAVYFQRLSDGDVSMYSLAEFCRLFERQS